MQRWIELLLARPGSLNFSLRQLVKWISYAFELAEVLKFNSQIAIGN
jgi:hypothetical protein